MVLPLLLLTPLETVRFPYPLPRSSLCIPSMYVYILAQIRLSSSSQIRTVSPYRFTSLSNRYKAQQTRSLSIWRRWIRRRKSKCKRMVHCFFKKAALDRSVEVVSKNLIEWLLDRSNRSGAAGFIQFFYWTVCWRQQIRVMSINIPGRDVNFIFC